MLRRSTSLLALQAPATINAVALDAARVQILNHFAATIEDRGNIPAAFPRADELKRYLSGRKASW